MVPTVPNLPLKEDNLSITVKLAGPKCICYLEVSLYCETWKLSLVDIVLHLVVIGSKRQYHQSLALNLQYLRDYGYSGLLKSTY